MPIVLCDDGHFDKVLPLAADRGWGMELQYFCNHPNFQNENPEVVEYQRSRLGRVELRSIHSYWEDLCPGSIDHEVQAVARSRFELSYQLACKFGASHLVMHYSFIPEMGPLERWRDRSAEFWRSFMRDKADDKFFHIENIFELRPEALADIMDQIDHPNVDICLDIGHAHCFSKVPVRRWIEMLGERIGYVHLHDNRGATDEHLALGAGTIALPEVFSLLREHCPKAVWAVETHPNWIEQSIVWLEEQVLSRA